MDQSFDVLGRYKYPQIKLCKPNLEGQGFLSAVKNLKITKRFASYDELSFEIDNTLNGVNTPMYSSILSGKILHAPPYGYFKIRDLSSKSDGGVETKVVSCVSKEIDISKNKITRFEQTARLYNPTNQNDQSTIIGFFLHNNSDWSVSKVSSNLWNVSRSFDVQNTDWYNFLVSDVSKKYKCFFVFTTETHTFECLSVEDAVGQTNIIADYDNLLSNIDVSSDIESVFTALNCNGAKYLDIRSVNPLGTNIIYNFKYFKSTEWISENLINKITVWENLIKKKQQEYSKILLSIADNLKSLTKAESELVEIQSDIKAVDQSMALALSNNSKKRYEELASEKAALISKENSKKESINSYNSAISILENSKKLINQEVGFESNFTATELKDLQKITIVDNYKNDGFSKTDFMTATEVQDESLNLYNFCTKILEEICVPRLYFKAELINFLFLKEYEKFSKQIDVGKQIIVQLNRQIRTPVVVLSVSIDFDNPNSFSMEFSNRPQLDNGTFTFSDVLKEISYSSSSYDWDKTLLGEPVKSGRFDEISKFINSNFDAAHNSLLTASGINMSFDGSGLHGRKIDENGNLDPCEFWATSNVIAISNDNFNTPPKVAIGKFKLPNSQVDAYGINAELLAGKLVVGNQFVFEAQDGSFRFDTNGAKLVNANFEVSDINNLRKISINQSVGIEIKSRQKNSDAFTKTLYFDMYGNGVFNGRIQAASGNIGGIRIAEDGIYNDKNGDYWKTDGTGKFGLMSYSLESATFDGNIYAKNLDGRLGSIPSSCYGHNSISGDCAKDGSISESKLSSVYTDKVTKAIAQVQIYADEKFSTIQMFTEFKQNLDNQITNAFSSFEMNANRKYATISQLTAFNNNVAHINSLANSNSASISLVVSGGKSVNTASIVSAINQSGSSIKLSASKIDMTGVTTFVRPADLAYNGRTTIDGGRIRTGTISADRIDSNYISSWFAQTGRLTVTRDMILAPSWSNNLTLPLRVGGRPVKVKFLAGQYVLGFDG